MKKLLYILIGIGFPVIASAQLQNLILKNGIIP
jgi:hypothetical protein